MRDVFRGEFRGSGEQLVSKFNGEFGPFGSKGRITLSGTLLPERSIAVRNQKICSQIRNNAVAGVDSGAAVKHSQDPLVPLITTPVNHFIADFRLVVADMRYCSFNMMDPDRHIFILFYALFF